MPVQPRTPPGVLELLPPQQLAFQHMLDTIRRGFERFGFVPVETPVFELSDVLLTKTGGDTEKQVYFVQSTGALKAGPGQGDAKLPELAMRFDLTVPLARYVAEHEPQLNFPFRRYQIQRVYRGERNQKGRYREFYQCDIDVIGKDQLPLAYDAEIPAVIYTIFHELAFGPFTIYVNNRRLLRGLLTAHGIADDRHEAVLHEIDRLGKQPRAEIEARLAGEGFGLDPARVAQLLELLTGHAGDSRAAFAALRALDGNPVLTEGIDELERVYDGTLALGVPARALQVNLAIVRGLDYYTGTIYETLLDEHPRLGSICSGGRYDNLAGHYTKSKLPGVGISIGATRLFSQLLDMNLIGAARTAVAHVLVLAVEPALAAECARIAAELRAGGLNVEVYGGDDKLGKQLKYADRSGIPLAVLYGSREQAAGLVKLKDLRANATTKEHDVPRGELVAQVQQLVG
ncbi:MAG TPA: histidine--tRNA ligase [Kofleriaceae bacterium]|jgi:histidyl-tRNA synthetase|nr:histidine--tRNA ligase [Kofleriaceae bacterium]